MKTNYSFIALAMLLFSFYEVSAQLKVHSNGNLMVKSSKSTDVPYSPLCIDTTGNGIDRLAVKGENTVIGAYRQGGSSFRDWTYGIKALNDTYTGGWAVGVQGTALSVSGWEADRRAYGVIGIGGGAAYGYNYGVFGTINYFR